MRENIEQSFGLQTMSSELKNAGNYHRWLISKIGSYLGSRVLEIGIGDGSYTKLLGKKELVVGIDLAEDCVNFCKKEFVADEYIKCFKVDLLADNLEEVKSHNLDSAFCFNVLEHVEDDVNFLKKVREIISEGSNFAIIVPAMDMLYGEMDRLAGHFRRYNQKSLVGVAEKAGWQVVKVEYINFLGSIGWWLANKTIKPKTLNDSKINKQIILFDKFILPITKVIDIFTKRFFGQSLLIILKKS